MATRTSVLLIASAIAIAAASFLLGSYVFPHAGSAESDAATASSPGGSSAAPDSSGLADFGIDVSTSSDAAQAPASASGSTPGSIPLDDSVLEALDAPVQGLVIGRVTASGDPTRTAEVRVDVFRIALKADDGSLDTYSLPAGTTVQLYFRPERTGGANAPALPQPGAAIRADVRVEPATDGSPGRVTVVSVEVMGSPQ